MASRRLKRWFNRWRKRYENKNDRVYDNRAVELSTVSSRVDTALHHNSRHRAGSLYQLPEDLMFMVCRYLTDAQVVMLMLSCTRFWRSRTEIGIFAERWKRMASPIEDDLNKLAARFYVLRMLEYDGLLQRGCPRKYCCWGCMRVHERQAFSPKELRKRVKLKSRPDFLPRRRNRRSCELAKRYIWFGLCREMSFVKLRHIITNPRTQQLEAGQIVLKDRSRVQFWGCSKLHDKRRQFSYIFEIASTRDIPTLQAFIQHSQAVNLPLCPHLRLGDQAVTQLYIQPSQPYTCKDCTTTVKIAIVQSFIFIYVFRYVGLLRSPTDPQWMAQSYRAKHRWVKAQAQAFGRWFVKTYGETGPRGRGYRPFKRKQMATLFEGVESCTPEWPGGGPTW
ncbi:predicted protein [Uncinocarpus reesii 1704]|uniref:F-box domain-containing protein n=1 Tax=Uncinocarpus reesii (strain UAMH 1704) TaxID=336963 RepID=C4JTX4_UNCRE|nr:uncharacterized protein UREG_05913 [Uncinocarpus reesii 1704]EEP81071.1 predicted protein [Uncinocarpus reesii 1704]